MKRFLRNLPIKHKLMALTVGISGVALLLACAVFAAYEQAAFRRTMARDFAIFANIFDENVASGLAFNDAASIEQALSTLNEDSRILAAAVFDKAGALVASFQRAEQRGGFVFPAAQSTSQHWDEERLDTFKDIQLAGEVIGVVYIGVDLGELRKRIWRYAAIVGVLLIGCSLVALVLASRLQRIISQPIVDLAHTVAAVTSKKDYAARAPKESDDELGRLIDGFNEMLAQIQARDAALLTAHHHLEKRVDERTAELASEITERKRAEESLRLIESAVDQSQESIVITEAELDEPGPRIVFVNPAFTRMTGYTAAEAIGKTPRILQGPHTDRAVLRRLRQNLERGEPFQGEAINYRKDGTEFVKEWQIAPLRHASGKTTHFMAIQRDITERKRTENDLRESYEKFHQLADNINDAFWIRSPDLSKVHYVSPAFERIWGRSVESLYANPQQWADFIVPEDRARVRDAFAALTGDAPSLDIEYRIARPDGEVRWIRVRGFQVRDATGKLIRHIGIVADVTTAKESEAALAKAHQELVDTSHQAGMAEVATGVLHNVGNVLNSVNVSATLVADRVRHTQAANIAKLAALFVEHKADLASFLTSDPRGLLLPDYLGALAESIAAEQTAQTTELEHLRKNVGHIKDIVATQQAYACKSGVVETVAVTDMIEDALRINAASLERHDVTTSRDYQVRPVVTTDRRKVMQVLINLVRNAKDACEESGRTDKLLTVRTASDGRGVKIAISDNGVGIPAENLLRIFNHGFTTRKDGHGFGLHSGALAARELGGSLSVQSDGPGRGATFTLELPVSPLTPAP